MGEITLFAQAEGQAVTKTLPARERKAFGQYMTPADIAEIMAQRASDGLDRDVVRILEPSAGTGVLAAAVVEILLDRPIPPARIELTLCEVDARFLPSLRRLADRLRRAAKAKGVKFSVSIRLGDFLLSAAAIKKSQSYDIIIANPPYRKLNKHAPQAVAHAYAVHGQPNIYGLFMAATAQLLAPDGRWCFITPRSWTNGSYFGAVRRHMLARLRIDAVHVFVSRQDHFTDDGILQEAMITWATAADHQSDIAISVSDGLHDLTAARVRTLPPARVIGGDTERVISLPVEEDARLDVPETLDSLGLKVSTGPVVAFRAKEHIRAKSGRNTVPLLWMQHVSRDGVSWPITKKPEQHIIADADSAWMLVPNAPMVLLRRFSPKEDVRRMTAAAYTGDLPGTRIGLENHLNYVYRPGGVLSAAEAKGIAAYLNSRHVDTYFRSVAGSTQVNAAEMRRLPMPTLAQLRAIGRRVTEGMPLSAIDVVVSEILDGREIAA